MASRKSKTRKKPRSRPTQRPMPQSAREVARSAPEKELAGLKPKPAGNERVEDLAVFTNVGREQLSDDLKLECTAVMESLDSVTEGNFAQANERLKQIARSSPYADWRLFVRGLCGFYEKDFETAKQNWQRLDATRRPARIANTLIHAELNQSLAEFAFPPNRLVEAARTLLHRSNAVSAAKQILSVKHRDSEVLFAPSQVAMLTAFRDDFRRVDPDFVAKFSQACVYHACEQNDPSVFMLLKKLVPGPPHDPRWNLQEFLFMQSFTDIEEDAEETVETYIKHDLPTIAQFSIEQKNAVASCMLLELAGMLYESERDTPFFYFSEPTDYKTIEQLLGKAIKHYPTNREAHKLLLDVLDRQVDPQRRATKSQIEAVEKRLINAKEAFVSAFPGEIETALQLVDHYFNNDEIDKADALVKQLSSQRLDAPLAKALPWKLNLLGAMHKSRRKAELNAARESLAVAESQWPTWFARTWLPFLRAALELRAGNKGQFESLDKQARQDANISQVVGDFMTFAAIQQMNVPSAVIKPFREAIAKYLANVEQLPLSDLLSIGAFFWDLSRTVLEHKGFRSQASKVGKAICLRLKNGETFSHSTELVDASCFCASRGYWQNGYEYRQPTWAEELSKTEPKLASAFIGWVIKGSYSQRHLVKYKPLVDSLQELAKSEKDPFYRYRFEQVATAALESIAEYNRGRRSPDMASRFIDIMGDDDDELDDDYIDENCQCADCRAERARKDAQAKRSTPKGNGAQRQRQPLLDLGFDDDDEDEDDFEEEDDFDDVEPIFDLDSPPSPELQAFLLKIGAKIGPKRLDQFGEAMGEAVAKAEHEKNPSLMMQHIAKVFNQFGLSKGDAIDFVRLMEKQTNAENGGFPRSENQYFENEVPQPTRPPMTPEERKAADKKRRRELEKKKRR